MSKPRWWMVLVAVVLVAGLIWPGTMGLPKATAQESNVRVIPIPGSMLYTFRVSPDGSIVAIFESPEMHNNEPGALYLPIRLINIASGKVSQLLAGFTDYARDVAFAPDGKTLASVHLNGDLLFWDVSTGKRINQHFLGFFASRMSYLADGRLVVAISGTPGRFFIIDPATGYITKIVGRRFTSYQEFMGYTRMPEMGDIQFVGFTALPDSKTLAAATFNDEIVLFDMTDGSMRTLVSRKDKKPNLSYFNLALTPDGKSLVSYSTVDAALYVWNLADGAAMKIPMRATNFALSADGDTVAWLTGRNVTPPGINVIRLSQPDQVTQLASLPDNLSASSAGRLSGMQFINGGKQLLVGGFRVSNEQNALLVIDVIETM